MVVYRFKNRVTLNRAFKNHGFHRVHFEATTTLIKSTEEAVVDQSFEFFKYFSFL
jgi:hypothetical protein